MAPISDRTQGLIRTARADGRVTAAEATDVAAQALPNERQAVFEALMQDGFTGTATDRTELAKLLGVVSAPAATRPVSAMERQTALAAMDEAAQWQTRGAGAQKMVAWLKQHPDPAHQAEFFQILKASNNPSMSFAAFGAANVFSEHQVVAQGLRAAMKAGAITPSDFTASGEGLLTGDTRSNHEHLGDIVARTRVPELIEAFVGAELDLVKGDPNFTSRANAALTALSGLQPEQLSQWLEKNPTDVQRMLRLHLNQPDSQADGGGSVGKILTTLSKLHPLSAASLKFFADSLPLVGKNPESREGVAQFLLHQTPALLSKGTYLSENGAIKLEKQRVLAEAMALTLFTEPAPASRSNVQARMMSHVGHLRDELQALGKKEVSVAQGERARELGSLVGTIEAGFHIATERIKEGNSAIDAAAALLNHLPSPATKILKLGYDQLKKLVIENMKEKGQSVDHALPFRKLYELDNSEVATHHDAARSDAFINSRIGLK